ncbi:GrrA/OscA1 family cyclophane-containing rSAM-modified RiPP, partial [Aphanothece microscopica]
MAFLIRSRLLGLLLLASLPLDCAAALATAAAQQAGGVGDGPATAQPRGVEERLRRIALAVQEQNEGEDRVGHPDGRRADAGEPPENAEPENAELENAELDGSLLALAWVNGPAIGWGNGGFRNGGFYNGGFRNGGFYNGGFRNGGFR